MTKCMKLNELSARQIEELKGGKCYGLYKDGVTCGCACAYADPDQGGSSIQANRNANWAGGGLNSPGCE